MDSKKKPNTSKVTKELIRYSKILATQTQINSMYAYAWMTNTLLGIYWTELTSPLGIFILVLFNILIGILAVGAVVKPVDKAFQSIGISFHPDYGKPFWIVEGLYPAKQESLKIYHAGFGPEEYEKYRSQLSARLNKTIYSITKPNDASKELLVDLRKHELPNVVQFDNLDIASLEPREFFIGVAEDASKRKLDLAKMPHMLVAGQPGSGKTQFIKQLTATVMTQTRWSHVCLIDMKRGIDFQNFVDAPNFEIATTLPEAEQYLKSLIDLHDKRADLLKLKKKTHWHDLSLSDLEKNEAFKSYPIGPILVVIDEFAQLSREARHSKSNVDLQETVETLAQLTRSSGFHIILGTQRPDKSIMGMQSKDCITTVVCFSVPSVAASNAALGDMSASVIGHKPGRCIFKYNGREMLQAPMISNSKIESLIQQNSKLLNQKEYLRLIRHKQSTNNYELATTESSKQNE